MSDGLADVVQADHRRDAQRAGHDGGVGGLAADIRCEAEHERAVELRGVRRASGYATTRMCLWLMLASVLIDFPMRLWTTRRATSWISSDRSRR